MTGFEDDWYVSCLSGTALPSYFQFQARPERPLRIYSLNILGISLAYNYKKRYGTNPFVLDQVYPRDMPEDYIHNESSLYIPCIYMVYTWYIQ
jgi:hypothetical protein